jgi:hypothetical protein
VDGVPGARITVDAANDVPSFGSEDVVDSTHEGGDALDPSTLTRAQGQPTAFAVGN